MNQPYDLLVTTPNNLEGLLLEELREMGLTELRETRGGVRACASLEGVYTTCLQSRLASRVLLPLTEAPATSADALYDALEAFPWEEHLLAPIRLAVDFHGGSAGIRHTRYGAQRVKDAIADRMRSRNETVRADPAQPDVRLSVRLRNGRAAIALDLSGKSLHRRGYRSRQTEAPLKEPLAAAILRRAGWPFMATPEHTLFDPCCGSGTLLCEGAMMAADMAPGLLRESAGPLRWRGHSPDRWQAVRAALTARVRRDPEDLPRFVGHDRDPRAVEATATNLRNLGLSLRSEIREADVTDTTRRWPHGPGLLATNPPYGHRLEAGNPVERLYMQLGDRARSELRGWRLAVLTTRSDRLAALGLRSSHLYRILNGQLACRLGLYEVHSDAAPQFTASMAPSPPADLVNRLRKNARHLDRWRRRNTVHCYRVYDADLPEYAFAVDLYETTEDGTWAHVQEYEPPAKIAPRKAEARRRSALAAFASVFELPPDRVILKVRRQRRAGEQYGRQGDAGRFHLVREGACVFEVNLSDYLDTGLFLDHRPLRRRIREEAAGKRFLNLFAYTGTASVHAALGGTRRTTSVDLSRRYTEWAWRNLRHNGQRRNRNEVIVADVVSWLADAANRPQRWDMALLDPPTFSRSKRMTGNLDLQRDHVSLIHAVIAVLDVGGVLYFSTNNRRFALDTTALDDLGVEDITAQTVPPDFGRRAPPHFCWRITREKKAP